MIVSQVPFDDSVLSPHTLVSFFLSYMFSAREASASISKSSQHCIVMSDPHPTPSNPQPAGGQRMISPFVSFSTAGWVLGFPLIRGKWSERQRHLSGAVITVNGSNWGQTCYNYLWSEWTSHASQGSSSLHLLLLKPLAHSSFWQPPPPGL